MKRNSVFMLTLVCTLLSGCNFFPEPVSLIQAPNQAKADNGSKENRLQAVKSFLPKGSALYVPNEPVGSSSILEADFNNDGKNERVAFYKSNIRSDQAGALVLEKENQDWKQFMNINGQGFEISWGSAEDITGDGRPELLLGWKIGVSAGSVLDVYTWKGNRLQKIDQLNFHKVDVLNESGQPRLAVWKRKMDDVYDIDVLKWERVAFKSDKDLKKSYYRTVANYYDQRTKEVPDASFYWYYLADAYLKADMPEAAQIALAKGLERKLTSPGWKEFESLQQKVETALAEKKENDVRYYEPNMDLTMNIPKDLYPYISIESSEGQANDYVMSVSVADGNQKALLFAIEAHSKEFIMMEEFPLTIIAENDQLVYGIRRNETKPTSAGDIYSRGAAMADEMVSSVRLGAPFTKYKITDDELLIKKVQEAYGKAVYVGMGGKLEGLIEGFPYNDLDYRNMGEDLGTMEKLNAFLAGSFTKEAIQTFVKTSGIVEVDGKLAQPNADGGSLLNYQRAEILKVNDLGTEVQYDLKVPVGNSLVFNTVHVVFKKTEEGWRISSNPIHL